MIYDFIFSGEATNLNLAHVMNVDCTDVNDLTMAEMEGRRQAMFALKVKTKGGLYGRADLIIMIKGDKTRKCTRR